MLSKQEVFAAYGNLTLLHMRGEDNAHRFVFRGIADDGAQIHVIHSSNLYIQEHYVRASRPVTLNVEPAYHLMQVLRNGEILFEEHQSVEY